MPRKKGQKDRTEFEGNEERKARLKEQLEELSRDEDMRFFYERVAKDVSFENPEAMRTIGTSTYSLSASPDLSDATSGSPYVSWSVIESQRTKMRKKKCTKCRITYSEGQNFCPECGRKLKPL